MHFSTVKIPIDFGLYKPSISVSFLILKAIFLTYLHCFCIIFSETTVVNISETIAGYRSNRSPLFIEVTFCHNSSMNISIDNRYCNRFIYIGRLIFPVNHNAASIVFTIPTTYGIAHERVTWLHSRGTGHPICDLTVRSSLLDSFMLLLFRQPITSPIIVFTSSPTCLRVQTQLQSI